MNFVMRPVNKKDLLQLIDLAKQFHLLNLPHDKLSLGKKIELSEQAFLGKLSKPESEYLFVLEDVEERRIVGSSLIMAKHGTEEIPHHYLKVLKKNHYSEDLGLGFIHQVLRFQMDEDGPTEIGGLVIDKSYRRRPEKVGKQVSLGRFMYMALHPQRFEDRVLCELSPPLTEDGRSEFWEAFGRRFTGLPYQEADLLSRNHKEFIGALFPNEDIYVCLLDSRARLVIGRVGEETRPAQHLLESVGFRYLEEVDPFDGAPHFGAKTEDIKPIQLGRRLRIASQKDVSFRQQGLIARVEEPFASAVVSFEYFDSDSSSSEIVVPDKALKTLQLSKGSEVFVSPFQYPQLDVIS